MANPSWTKGCPSPNPGGRKKGSRNRRSILMEELERDGSELAQLIKTRARDGDSTCISLWFTRLEPVARIRGETVEVAFDPTATPAQNIETVLRAVAAGDMSVETGAQLISGIEKLANVRVAEVTEDKELALIKAFREIAQKMPV